MKRKRGRHVDGANNNVEENVNTDFEYQYEELESGPESNDDGDVSKKAKFPYFIPLSSLNDYKWEAELLFESKSNFKDAIITNAV